MSIPERLLALRHQRGLTRAQASAQSGIANLRKYEEGIIRPGEGILQRIAAFYGVRPEDIGEPWEPGMQGSPAPAQPSAKKPDWSALILDLLDESGFELARVLRPRREPAPTPAPAPKPRVCKREPRPQPSPASPPASKPGPRGPHKVTAELEALIVQHWELPVDQQQALIRQRFGYTLCRDWIYKIRQRNGISRKKGTTTK